MNNPVPRYGGNDGAIGPIIYNNLFLTEPQLQAKNNLSERARIIFEEFENIWEEDEQFGIALRAIEHHLSGQF